MDWIKDKLSGIGAFLALAGILSSVLYLLGYNLRILMWVDMWGVGVGWGIRLGLIVVGAVLFFMTGSGAEGSGEQGSGASGGADADDDDEDWDSFRARVRADPRFAELLAKAQQQHNLTFDPPTDPDTYQVVHWAFTNDTGQQLGPEDPSVLYLSLYCQRQNKPKRISVGTTLAKGEVVTTELSGMQWNYLVP